VAHAGNVNCISIGRRTGKIIATGGDDQSVNIWGVGKPNCLHKLTGHTSAIEAVTFDNNEATVVGGSASGTLKLWDLSTGKIVRTLNGHKSNIRSVDFHPYGEFIASGSLDTSLKVWDIRRKGCIQAYKGHEDVINCIRFSPDGRWIITGSEDKTIKLWDLTAGKMLQDFKLHTGAITSIEFHPNEFLLASGSADRTVKIWDLETFKPICTSSIEASRVRSVCFGGDNSLFSGGQDSLRAYGWEPNRTFESAAPGWGKLQDLCRDGDGSLIGASCQQNVVSLWSVNTTGVAEGIPPPTDPTEPAVNVPQQRPATTSTNQSPVRSAAPDDGSGADRARLAPRAPAAAVAIAKSPEFQRRSPEKAAVSPASPPKVIPASRDAPMGLDMNAFLATAETRAPDVDVTQVLEAVSTGHSSMLQVMSKRLRKLQVVKTQWIEGKYEAAVNILLELADTPVFVDVLQNVMLKKPAVWNLSICMLVLPSCNALFNSQYESYIEAGCEAVQLVLKSFGKTIKDNIKKPPTGGIDISREERYEKCVACRERLEEVRQTIQPRLADAGKVGSSVRLLNKALDSVM
jgi:katanin p80 WD40 repeat-containing subunit B1